MALPGRRRRADRTRQRRLLGALCIGIALTSAGCGAQPAPDRAWPDGALLIARTDALARLLAQLQELSGTKIAHRAAALAASLPDCPWLEGRSDTGVVELWSQLACRDGDSALAGLDHARGERDIAFALPGEAGARVIGTLSVLPAGDVEAELRLPHTTFANARALLYPAAATPGPALLNDADELVHARVRPDGGLDLAALVPAHSQADRLFRLKSKLFAGAVLDGTWETAIYLPEPGRPMPRSALAVGFAHAQPAVAAMEDFLAELQATWPVRRSDFAVGDARGACLLDLNVLPELAPCYVATSSALVVGWNPGSVRQALARPADDARALASPPRASGLRVDLARLAEADAHFAQLEAPDERPARPAAVPWRQLTAAAERDGDAVRLRVALDGGAGA